MRYEDKVTYVNKWFGVKGSELFELWKCEVNGFFYREHGITCYPVRKIAVMKPVKMNWLGTNLARGIGNKLATGEWVDR